ncbi:hypothetical protein BCR35DRAFT_354956 [Leucosporidium creatinivorum]|uniref:Zn(2)-C6 fungal-type domain-containing protein n=1 Tax=Leucosporidium creatinivorum TaxID=106004 RepID=A0A1Y2E1L4_9BASI|nr:hypothetical protein BCR35DRAFT_354956 [Leucosporidium creatinivorum]
MENHVPGPASEPPAPVVDSPPLQPIPCNSCVASGVPCQVRTEAKFAKAACRRCHKNKTSCSLSGARRPPKPKPAAPAPTDLLRGPVTLPPSNAALYGPFSTSHVRGPVFGGPSSYTFSPPEPSTNSTAFPPPPPSTTSATIANTSATAAPVASTSAPVARRPSTTPSLTTPTSRPIAPLPARPVQRLSLTPRDAPPPPPPAGTQQYEEVLRRQLNAAQAALRAAHAEKDAVVAERDALVLSVRAEAAARHAEAAQSHAAEARIAASADYVERSHTAFTKLFTEPRLRSEDDSVTLEMMREMWVAFAQAQLEVLEGRNGGRELEDLLSEEAVERARRVIDGSLREQEREREIVGAYGAEGEEEDLRYDQERDAEGEVLMENGEEERDELASPSPPKMEEELAAAHHVLALGAAVSH